MKLIKPSFEILDDTHLLKGIELAARTCYKSEGLISDDDSSAIKLVSKLVKRKHRAMLEFGPNLIFEMDIDYYDMIHRYDFRFLQFSKYEGRFIVSGSPRAWIDFIDMYISYLDENLIRSILYHYPELAMLSANDDLSAYDNTPIDVVVKPISMSELNYDELFIHGFMTVKFVTDRGVSHEYVRHRYPVSFAQESTRYVNYSRDKNGGEIKYIIPPWLNMKEGKYSLSYINNTVVGVYVDGEYIEELSVSNNTDIIEWLETLQRTEKAYMNLLNMNWSPQQARHILPNGIKTEILVKTNFFEWYHIFEQRIASSAHPQAREIMIPLYEMLRDNYSSLFGDLNVLLR